MLSVRTASARVLAWLTLFGGLLTLEVAHAGHIETDDAVAYKAAAVFSLLMFLFLVDWLLAALLFFMAAFMGWHALTSTDLTAGAAMVALGISPVIAFLAAYLEHSQTSDRRRRPKWLSEDPFFDFCGRRR